MSSGPRSRPWKTVGVRLTLFYSGWVTASALLVLGLAYLLLATSLERRDREAILDELGEVAALHRGGGLVAVREFLAVQEGSGRAERFVIRVLAPDGAPRFVWRHPDLAAFDGVDLGERPPGPAGRWRRIDAGARGTPGLELVSAALGDGGRLEVGGSTEDRDAVLRSFRRVALLVLAVVVALGVPGGALLAASALRPVRQLVRAMRAAAAGEMRTRVTPRQSGDELDELVRLFNSMLARIAALIDGMRGAVDNVAHELRTPIMRMRGTAELALRSPEPERLRHALGECVEELDQLLTMLNTVMDIAEAEAGALTLHPEPVDVGAVTAEMVELYHLVAQDRGVALAFAGADLPPLTVDRNRLRQAIANLLDNAIKYTPAGGRVDVRAARDERGIVIAVRDTGRGIAPAELERIWERLFRGAGARGEPGLGLGLSLVRAIVQAHGGRIDVTSTVGAGSEFTIVLPPGLARAPAAAAGAELTKV